MVENENVNSILDPQKGVRPTMPFWEFFVGLNNMFSPVLWIYCRSMCKTITHLLRLYKSEKDLGQSWERKIDYLFQNMKVPWDVLSWHGQMLAVKILNPGTISLNTCFQSHERRKESLILLNFGFSILKIILFRVAYTNHVMVKRRSYLLWNTWKNKKEGSEELSLLPPTPENIKIVCPDSMSLYPER